jgi:hypothetical protein
VFSLITQKPRMKIKVGESKYILNLTNRNAEVRINGILTVKHLIPSDERRILERLNINYFQKQI